MFDKPLIQDDERVQALNRRLASRNIGGQPMNPAFDPRAQHTKYHRFPVFDKGEKDAKTPMVCNQMFNPNYHYLPGDKAPYSGYAVNVNNESRLRNAFMPRQKYADQSYYVPSTKSDMYNEPQFENQQKAMLYDNMNPHPSLFFNPHQFAQHDTNPYNIKQHGFNTHTRQEVKNIPSFLVKGKADYNAYLDSEDVLLSTKEISDENGRNVYLSNTTPSYIAYDTNVNPNGKNNIHNGL